MSESYQTLLNCLLFIKVEIISAFHLLTKESVSDETMNEHRVIYGVLSHQSCVNLLCDHCSSKNLEHELDPSTHPSFTEVSQRFHRGFTEVSQRFHRGFTEVSRRFQRFHRGFRGFTEVSHRFHRGFRGFT